MADTTVKVMVCGSRKWNNYDIVCAVLETFHDQATKTGKTLTILSGMARGADSCGVRFAKANRLALMEFPASWDRLGKGAGAARNVQMVKNGDPDIVVAFTNDLEASKGTYHACTVALEAGKHVWVVDGKYNMVQLSLPTLWGDE